MERRGEEWNGVQRSRVERSGAEWREREREMEICLGRFPTLVLHLSTLPRPLFPGNICSRLIFFRRGEEKGAGYGVGYRRRRLGGGYGNNPANSDPTQLSNLSDLPAWGCAPALPSGGGYSSEEKKKMERDMDAELGVRGQAPGGL